MLFVTVAIIGPKRTIYKGTNAGYTNTPTQEKPRKTCLSIQNGTDDNGRVHKQNAKRCAQHTHRIRNCGGGSAAKCEYNPKIPL